MMLKIKNIVPVLLKILSSVLLIWGLLTLYVQQKGPAKATNFGKKIARHNALVVYDPDPFYNLDEQVCEGFAKGLSNNGWLTKVATVRAAEESRDKYDLYVFCANTYNGRPDRVLTKYIESFNSFDNVPVVAITLGSGSTDDAKAFLENQVIRKNGRLTESVQYWLMKPNDENRLEESNVDVAVEKANQLGILVGQKYTQHFSGKIDFKSSD